jgi:hypothetical protein
MNRTVLAIALSALSSQCGCYSPDCTEINGKLIISSEATGTQVLDTGNDGKKVVSTGNDGDDWGTRCELKNGAPMIRLSYSAHEYDGLWWVRLWANNDLPPGPFTAKDAPWSDDKSNADFCLFNYDFHGVCSVVFEKIGNDPYGFNISTSACELGSLDAGIVPIKSASFHVKTCPSGDL